MLNSMSVKQRVYKTTLTFIHRLKHVKLRNYLSELVIFNREIHNYPTRSRNDCHIALKKTIRDGNYLLHNGLKAFNELPSDIKNSN